MSGQERRQTVYLVRKGKEYLMARTDSSYETDPAKMNIRFSIYRYDAAQLFRKEYARQIIRILKKDGEQWSVVRFNKVTWEEREYVYN